MKTKHEQINAQDIKAIDDWLMRLDNEIERYGNGYATITVYDEDKDLFKRIMNQFKELTNLKTNRDE